jgi:LAS superfamily LD-carboxypeptidase LdcB
MYNEELKYNNFNSSKALFITSNNSLSKSNKIKITLPKYLHKNEIVDIYGINSNDEIEIIKKNAKVNKKSVTFNLSNNYKKYFITYVKVTNIELEENIETVKNEQVVFNIKYSPSTSTKKEVEYTNLGDAFVIRDKNIIAKKTGEYKITIENKESNIKKEVNIKVKKNENVIKKRNGITYINDIIIVNKSYPVDKDYNPESLTTETKEAFEKMKEAALNDGIKLWIASGFRSYETQEELYNYYVSKNGKEKADTFSARAGYSEHQTGLAMDLNIVDSSFEGTKEAIWIEKNCYKYGFIVRYPKDKESITGYKYEPWHIRYLGEQLASKLYNSGLTLEEYLDITSKYDE